jgi:hypothetical protein
MNGDMKCHTYDVSYTEMTTNTRFIQECMTTEWSGPWNIILYYPPGIVIGIMRILHKNRITSILFGSPPTNDYTIGPPTEMSAMHHAPNHVIFIHLLVTPRFTKRIYDGNMHHPFHIGLIRNRTNPVFQYFVIILFDKYALYPPTT